MGSENTETHYETLGVAQTADQVEIRRAYLAAARKWHPDGHLDRSPQEASRADSAMRRVNEAWKVLGSLESRQVYDRELIGLASESHRRGVQTSGGVTRIDPRYLDPEVLAGRRQRQQDRTSHRSAVVMRLAPVVAILSVLVGVLIFTAYARDDTEPASSISNAGTVSGADGLTQDSSATGDQTKSMGAGIDPGDCVSLLAGGSLLERPCGPGAIGKVIGPRPNGESCPITTAREVLLSTGVVVCLGPV